MKYFKGIYFCHKPIVAPEKYYDCRHVLDIHQISENCPVEEMSKALSVGTPEWNNCVKILKLSVDGIIERLSTFETSANLKQEVIDWLNENIADSTDKRRNDMPQGWMIYDPEIVRQRTSVSVFFLRGADAMAFKLRWS